MARTKADTGKRERILEGAIEAFAAKGFHRTRVSDVAKAAGVADGTIYLYFKNKDDLLASVFQETLDRFWARGQEYVDSASTPREQLLRFAELHLQFLGENRNLATVFQVDLRHSLGFLGEVSRRTLARYLEQLEELVRAGQASGDFREGLDPRAASFMVFGVCDQLTTSWVLSRRNYRLESQIPTMREFIGRALAP